MCSKVKHAAIRQSDKERTWRFASVVEKNARLVRDHVFISALDEHHPEGTCYKSGMKLEIGGAARRCVISET